jgi:DNA-binding GntR family transcriptional regulator
MIDPNSPELMFRQLVRLLEDEIASGKLPPRSKVMPQLKMTRHYKVSRVTVARALAVLSEEGLVYWVKGKGYFTAESEIIETWLKQRAG